MIGLDSPTIPAIVASLGWTLLHFLWQGAVAGVLFGLALGAATHATARTRYRIGLFFLGLLALAPVVTFVWLVPSAGDSLRIAATTIIPATSVTVGVEAAAEAANWRAMIDPYVPWTVLVWALGVTVMTGRLLLEWREVRRLTRRDVDRLPPEWQRRVVRLSERLGVRRAVRVLQTGRVHVPLVIGWLKPVILVPVSAFSGLTTWQLELILMHELAHVRRHDYIVNLLQVVVETLLFYHPVVRWVSRVVREEREHCCDDFVVARTGDALGYARALTELAGAQTLGLQTSVGSDGGKLLKRIKRIVIASEPRRVTTHWSVGMMLAVFGLSVSGLIQPGTDRTPVASQFSPATASDSPGAAQSPEEKASIDTVRPLMLPVPKPALAPAEPQSQGATVTVPPSDEPAAPEPTEPVTPPAIEAAEMQMTGASMRAERPRNALWAVLEVPDAAIERTTLAVATIEAPTLASPEAPERSGPGAGPAMQVAMTPELPEVPAARPISLRQPEFPSDARLDGIEGWVRVSYTIGRDGNVRGVQILDARPRNVFEHAVRRAVRAWRFEPILVDGTPAERQITQTIEFALHHAQGEVLCPAETGTRLCRATD